MRRLLLVLGLLAAVAALAGTARAVIGGSLDGSAHPYVGMSTNGGTVCSGSLVAPTVYITAAHCFAGQTSVLGDVDGNPIVGVGFDPAPVKLTLRGVVYNDPQFCADCGKGGTMTHDVAVVILTTPQPGPYASLPSLDLSASLPKNAAVTIVGYGAVAGADKKSPVQVYTRYAGDGTLKKADGKVADSFIGLAGKNGGATPCFGDSGGPDLVAGTSTIVGITSWAKSSTCLKASYSYRLDTAEALGFIQSVVAAHA